MRKREPIQVPSTGFGRDAGKTFLITEWPAETAENWAWRAIIAYNRGGGQIPIEAMQGGMEAIFWLGVNTFLRGQMQADEVIPILNELLKCVQIIRDPKAMAVDGSGAVVHPLLPDDIEEVKTRLWLRSEVLRVHTNFSVADLISRLISEMAKREEKAPPS